MYNIWNVTGFGHREFVEWVWTTLCYCDSDVWLLLLDTMEFLQKVSEENVRVNLSLKTKKSTLLDPEC